MRCRGCLVLRRRRVRRCGLMVLMRDARRTEGRFAKGGEEEQVVRDLRERVRGDDEIEVESE
jgi:hypothetical protein